MTHHVQGFDFSVDLLQALLWQYDNAARLRALIEQKQAWYAAHQTAFWSDWVRDVFDLRTANDFGLGVWAQILNVPLTAVAEDAGPRPSFGFGEHHENFFGSTFGRDNSGALYLTTEQRRLILRLRYYQLVTRGCVPEVNAFLRELFGPGVYMLDGLDMTVVYVFTYAPSADVLMVLEQFDLLPRVAGVKATFLVEPKTRFGFGEHHLNFENGNFGG